MEERAFCLCCGYELQYAPRSYDICEVCYWEDDPYQAENPFYAGGANTIPLVVAKSNYEKIGASEARFKEMVVSPKSKTRDPNYKTSKELVLANPEIIKSEIAESNSSDQNDLLHFYLNEHYTDMLETSKEISEKILQNSDFRFVWVKVARMYFQYFDKARTRRIWEFLEERHNNSWEELQNILREFA